MLVCCQSPNIISCRRGFNDLGIMYSAWLDPSVTEIEVDHQALFGVQRDVVHFSINGVVWLARSGGCRSLVAGLSEAGG